MQISKFDSEDEEFPDEDELDKDMKKCETSLSLYKSGIFSNINTLKSKVGYLYQIYPLNVCIL